MLSTHAAKSVRSLVAALVLVAVCSLPGPAKSPLPGRSLSLYLTVEQGDKLIQGLKPENFRVYEDGRSRTFGLSEAEKPASIVLLVEHSQASWLYLQDIAQAMQGFLKAAPEGHWYALATFAYRTTVDVDFTKQLGKIVSAFADLGQPMWNEINTYDAVFEMLERLSRLAGRRILIVIGSGYDTFSNHTLDDVQKQIEATNVTVFALGAGSLLRSEYDPYLGALARMDLVRAEAFLRMLADKSGGEAWFPRFSQAFPEPVQAVMQMIESQYRIVYDSQVPRDGRFHKIKVESFALRDDRRTDYKVRVREGWRF